MKLSIYLLFFCMMNFSCSSFFKRNTEAPETISSDLFPNQISRAAYYENLGDGYANNHQTDQAIDLFRLSILHDSKNLNVRVKLAEQYIQKKEYYLAELQLQQTLLINPNNTRALSTLGNLYLLNSVDLKAKEVYSKILQINPNHEQAKWALYFIYKKETSYNEAYALLLEIEKNVTAKNQQEIVLEKYDLLQAQQKNLEAESVLISSYQNHPDFVNVANKLSDIYIQKKNWNQSYLVLNRYSQTQTFNLSISQKLSYVALQKQDYELALQEYEKQLKDKPYYISIQLKIAQVNFLLQKYAQAEDQFKVYLQYADSDEALYYLAKVYQLTNRVSESIGLLNRLDSQSEYFAISRIEIANLQKESDFQLALQTIRKAYSEKPESLDLVKVYADFLIADKKFYESIVILEDGIHAFPNDEELRLKIAFSFYQINNKESFQQQMAAAISINPDHAEIYSTLAELWFTKSKKSSEVEFFARKAIELKSKNLNLKPLLAWALLAQNKSSEAIALFEESYEQNPDQYYYAKSLADVYRYTLIPTKAKQFSQLAMSLESKDILGFNLKNKETPKNLNIDINSDSKNRSPASLDAY